MPCSKPSSAGTGGQAARDSRPQPLVQLDYKLCEGETSTTVMGAYEGGPAVVKLYGPDTCGVAAYWQELRAYRRLQGLQHEGVVPRVLGAGRLGLDVYFLATRVVKGTPLSRIRPVTPQQAEAALRALGRLHSVRGFLHGDLHLGNVVLLEGGGGTDAERDTEDESRCVILDFGMAQLDASKAEQRWERKELERLLGV